LKHSGHSHQQKGAQTSSPPTPRYLAKKKERGETEIKKREKKGEKKEPKLKKRTKYINNKSSSMFIN
jgi:hypothetical protein